MESFAHVVGEWREAALAAGVGPSTIAEALEGLTPDERVLQRVTAQAEHELSVADYIARLVSDERISTGAQNVPRARGPAAPHREITLVCRDMYSWRSGVSSRTLAKPLEAFP